MHGQSAAPSHAVEHGWWDSSFELRSSFTRSAYLDAVQRVRDYIFVDKFEAAGRTVVSGDMAKDDADSSLINNVLFQAGVSFWVPPSFEYTTFR